MYATHVLDPLGLFVSFEGSGGPGRGRSHNEAGMVNTNHQAPTRNNTTPREKVVLFIAQTTTMQMHCRSSPAPYPIPIPVDDICVETRSSIDVRFLAGGNGLVRSGDGDRRAAVESSIWSPSGLSREFSGGCSSKTVEGRSGVRSGVWYCVLG